MANLTRIGIDQALSCLSGVRDAPLVDDQRGIVVREAVFWPITGEND